MSEQTAPPTLAAVLNGEVVVSLPMIQPLLDNVTERRDCADFHLATLLKLLYDAPQLADDAREAITAAALGFRYWLDEPGDDSMCSWSENHYILFAACEMLAGQHMPEARFSNNGMIGTQREEHGRERVRQWLEWRFRFGFSEWHSPVYYEQDVAAMVLIIDLCDDAELVERATMILDLLLLDMAIHRFNGAFVGSSGRCYEDTKKFPRKAPVHDILAHAFGIGRTNPVWDRLTSLFLTTTNYVVPPVLRSIAQSEGYYVCKDSSGLDIAELGRAVDDVNDLNTAGHLLWQMEAFTTPATVDLTVKALQQWSTAGNSFLKPLQPLTKVPTGKRLSPLRALIRTLNPVTSGMALQRANVYSYRTPSYHLSSVQHYHPGEFGDQQHLWQVSLPRDLVVFATNPGGTELGAETRNQTPNAWVGNGINPEIGQHENVLVALYDTRGRAGHLEKKRVHASHLYLQRSSFDESRLGPNWFVGRIGDAYLAIRSLGQLEMVSTHEIVQHGEVTGYGVAVFDSLDFDSLADVQALVRDSTLKYDNGILSFALGRVDYAVRWGKGFTINGKPVTTEFQRYDNPWVQCSRGAQVMEIACYGQTLTLDWARGIRSVGER